VPDVQPDIDLESARALVRRAVDKAEQLGISGAIAVVGASGALVTSSRMDEGGAGGMGRARSKAWIAATQKIPSTEHLHRLGVIAPAVAAGFAAVSPEASFPGAGGMPIRDKSGRIIGGIAASGSTVAPFFPPELDRSLSVVDGQPANPEDQVIAYALGVPYVGQHGDDRARWEARYGDWVDGPFDDLLEPETAAAQPVLARAMRIADNVLLHDPHQVAVTVVDRRGEVVQQDAMDGAPAGASYVAEAIAAASALYGVPSKDAVELVRDTGHLMPVPVAAIAGGAFLADPDGRIVAGIGVAGADPRLCDLIVNAAASATS
jgi:uncharacterized protein GlcG (DUF336 family)